MNNILSRFFSHQPRKADLTSVGATTRVIVPEDSMLKRHFLTQLRAQVETELFPNTTDSSLEHYYQASIAAEFQKRLAA